MSEGQTRAAQIFERFKKFHAANPAIWQLFKEFTLDRINNGYQHHSAFAVINRIRWECHIDVVGDGQVKLSNGFTPYYARLFAVAYPQHADFFRYRKLTTEEKQAHQNDIDFIDFGPPDEEKEALLRAEMEKLLGQNGDSLNGET